MTALCQHAWPGNIRELENVIERTLLFADGPRIELADLPPELHKKPAPPNLARVDSTPLEAMDSSNASMKEIVRKAAADLERDLIVKALEETGGNVTRAAGRLGISRKGLQNKMKEFGLREEKG